MAVEPVGAGLPTVDLDSTLSDLKNISLKKDDKSGKVSPEQESEMMETFFAGMITNQLMMNNQLFDFAKEALDEAQAE